MNGYYAEYVDGRFGSPAVGRDETAIGPEADSGLAKSEMKLETRADGINF